MSQAEELLNGLEEPIKVRTVNPDNEPHIVINPDKTVTIPDELKRILVQHEHNIETVTFDCPRYWDGHDLSMMSMRIVFERSDGHREPHPVENLRVDDADANMIHFEWTISKNTTLKSGNVRITICAKIANADGIPEREWHTIPNRDLFVNEGMDCSGDEIAELNPDLIESILARLDIIERGGVPDELDISWVSNTYIFFSTGEAKTHVDYSMYSATDYIDVSKVNAVKIRTECAGEYAGVSLYDSNKNYIKGSGYKPLNGEMQTVDVSNASYIRVTCLNTYLDKASVEIVSAGENAEQIITGWYVTLGDRMKHLLAKATEKKICCIVDDDTVNVDSVTLLQRACNANGIKATLACLTKNFEYWPTLSNTLLEMEKDGFQIVIHAHSQNGSKEDDDFWWTPESKNAAGVDNAKLCEADLMQGLRTMKSTGFMNYEYWVTPYCKDSASIQRIARKLGMKCVLAGGNAYEPADDTNGRYAIRRAAFGISDKLEDASITLDTLKSIAEQAAANNGWLIIMTHFEKWNDAEYIPDVNLSDPDYMPSVEKDRFSHLVRYLKDRGFEFMTVAEAWSYRKAIYDLYDML